MLEKINTKYQTRDRPSTSCKTNEIHYPRSKTQKYNNTKNI